MRTSDREVMISLVSEDLKSSSAAEKSEDSTCSVVASNKRVRRTFFSSSHGLSEYRFLKNNRGLTTVTAIFMLLLLISMIIIVATVFSNVDFNSKTMNKLEFERLQERISLVKQVKINEIESVVITNDGSIGVQIRALYEINDGEVEFLGDPTNQPSLFVTSQTFIPPGEFVKIGFLDDAKPPEQALIVAATERGTKSFDIPLIPLDTPGVTYPPSDLVLGPLLLKFKDFQYQEVKGGTIDPYAWKSGWDIPKGISCAWKIRVTNIDNRSITISRHSGLTPVANEFSTIKTWFVEPNDSATLTQLLPAKQDTEIIFIWSTPKNPPDSGLVNTPATFYNAACTSSVFLTFYGLFNYEDGTTKPYAQTIPFEAVVMSK